MPSLWASLMVLFLATGAHAAPPSVNLTPNRPALFMVLNQAWGPIPASLSLPLFRPDLTLDEPADFRLTPRWIEGKGIKVQLVGDDVVVTMPFVSRPRRWLANRLRRLAGLSRKRS